MGGMSAFLPVSSMSEEEAKAVMIKVLADKTNELAQGTHLPLPHHFIATRVVIFLPLMLLYPYAILNDDLSSIYVGCDGAWVAHPAMVKPIQDLFNQTLKGADNQISSTINLNADTTNPYGFATAPTGGAGFEYTEAGLRDNISVSIQYIASWLSGSGAVAIKVILLHNPHLHTQSCHMKYILITP